MKHWSIPSTSILHQKHSETFGWARVSRDRSLVSVGFMLCCDCFYWLVMSLSCTLMIDRYSCYVMFTDLFWCLEIPPPIG
jgi:hypothetical protein